ncbi:MAG: archease [Ignavibacteriaceae bacterium]
MSWEFNFIDHTADIAVEVKGDTIEELFTASAFAWQESVIEKSDINLSDKRELNIEEISCEELLVRFLDELNYLLLTKKWIMGKLNHIEIKKKEEMYNLRAVISGESISLKRHHLKVEIKAVTFHQMEIRKVNTKYSTRIIFDI